MISVVVVHEDLCLERTQVDFTFGQSIVRSCVVGEFDQFDFDVLFFFQLFDDVIPRLIDFSDDAQRYFDGLGRVRSGRIAGGIGGCVAASGKEKASLKGHGC